MKKILSLSYLILCLGSCKDFKSPKLFELENKSLLDFFSHKTHSPSCEKPLICIKSWEGEGKVPRCQQVVKSRKRRDSRQAQAHLLSQGMDIHCEKIRKKFERLKNAMETKLSFFSSQREKLAQKIKVLKKYFYQLKGKAYIKREYELHYLTYLNDYLLEFLALELKNILPRIDQFQNEFLVNHISKEGDQGSWQNPIYRNYENLWKSFVLSSFESISKKWKNHFGNLQKRLSSEKKEYVLQRIFSGFKPNALNFQLKSIEKYLKKFLEDLKKTAYCPFPKLGENIQEFYFSLKDHFPIPKLPPGLSTNFNLQTSIKSHNNKVIKSAMKEISTFIASLQICHGGKCFLSKELEKIQGLELDCFLFSK